MGIPVGFKEDVESILKSGVNHTGHFTELLQMRGWGTEIIMPVVYQLLLMGKLNPNGNKQPYKTN
jgi:hypothetical protein